MSQFSRSPLRIIVRKNNQYYAKNIRAHYRNRRSKKGIRKEIPTLQLSIMKLCLFKSIRSPLTPHSSQAQPVLASRGIPLPSLMRGTSQLPEWPAGAFQHRPPSVHNSSSWWDLRSILVITSSWVKCHFNPHSWSRVRGCRGMPTTSWCTEAVKYRRLS